MLTFEYKAATDCTEDTEKVIVHHQTEPNKKSLLFNQRTEYRVKRDLKTHEHIQDIPCLMLKITVLYTLYLLFMSFPTMTIRKWLFPSSFQVLLCLPTLFSLNIILFTQVMFSIL